MKIKRFSAWWAVFFGGTTVIGGCGLVAGLSDISDSKLVPDAGNDTGPIADANGDADGPVVTQSWCAHHKSAGSFDCFDFDESTIPPKANVNNCPASVNNSSFVLSNSSPNILSVNCSPVTDPSSTDDILIGYGKAYSSPNGVTLNMDVYFAPYDAIDDQLMALFRVGLADGTWWMEYQYSFRKAAVVEYISSNPTSGSFTQIATHPALQMNMSTSPSWYNLRFSIDFVQNRAWLAFDSDPTNPTEAPVDGQATSYLNSYPIQAFGDGGTAATFDPKNDGAVEVRWGLAYANPQFQKSPFGSLILNYDNVDIEPIGDAGVPEGGPLFP